MAASAPVCGAHPPPALVRLPGPGRTRLPCVLALGHDGPHGSAAGDTWSDVHLAEQTRLCVRDEARLSTVAGLLDGALDALHDDQHSLRHYLARALSEVDRVRGRTTRAEAGRDRG